MVFQKTGDLHSIPLFRVDGEFLMQKEGKGRHTPICKIAAHQFIKGGMRTPAHHCHQRASKLSVHPEDLVVGIAAVIATGAPIALIIDGARNSKKRRVCFAKPVCVNVGERSQRIIDVSLPSGMSIFGSLGARLMNPRVPPIAAVLAANAITPT